MDIIAKPHPSSKEMEFHSMIDLFAPNDVEPWGCVFIDMFYSDKELYNALYKDGKSVVLSISWKLEK